MIRTQVRVISPRVEHEESQKRTLQDLEWPLLCQEIARLTVSELGRQRALDLGPAPDQSVAETRLSVMGEVLALSEAGFSIPAGLIRDVKPAVELLRRQGVASGSELREIGRMLSVAGLLDRFGGEHEDTAPLLARVLVIEPELAPLSRDLGVAIDEEGRVRDEASPGLAAARRSLASMRGQVQKRVEELINRYRDALQDGYFAERDGRYVLPVRADAPFRVEGIVLGTSASGATLYVEPEELGQLGNRLRLLQVDVEREEALVLAALSSALAPHADEILWALDVCVRADLLKACCQLSVKIGARVVPFDEPGVLDARAARHPLLCLKEMEVVASDLRVAPNQALVLSGPNAGGKTVALKTLGLLALLQATGLPVPAAPGSRIGFFDEVLSDIGDDQSLSMSLSSFSGHVRRVKQVLEEAGHGTLVLFDELMSGTDPDEGAMLAIATIEELVRSGAAVCVTTHYEPLKEHAAQAGRLLNGAVGFDFELMAPTFRVEMGRPGASSAIIVAQRHGLPTTITERALALMPEVAKKKREEALSLEEQTIAFARETERLKAAREEQETLNRKLELELERAQDARRRDLGRESDALRIEVGEARAELRRLRLTMKKAGPNEFASLERSVDGAAKVVAVGGQVDRDLRAPGKKEARPLLEQEITVGRRVKVSGFTDPAEILQLPRKGQVQVLLGVMKMSVPLDQIYSMEGGAKQAPAPKTNAAKASLPALSGPASAPLRTQDVTLDLRGVRVEQGLLDVDHFVDELLRRQEMGGYVLHGHGTGAMKDAVRSHLRGHSCIIDSRPAERDEGGDAFTVFWLSGG